MEIPALRLHERKTLVILGAGASRGASFVRDAVLPPPVDIYRRLAPGVVQPPLTTKSVKSDPFNAVWRRARHRVKSARRLILIGYSMPVADGLVRSLLSTDLQSVLEDVFVVEPDPATRDRHIEFFTRRAQSARVYVFSTLAEFAEMLG